MQQYNCMLHLLERVNDEGLAGPKSRSFTTCISISLSGVAFQWYTLDFESCEQTGSMFYITVKSVCKKNLGS